MGFPDSSMAESLIPLAKPLFGEVFADVATEIFFFKLYLLSSRHRLCQCLCLIFSVGADGNDTTAGGDQLAILQRGAGMEDDTAFYLGTRDGETLLIALGITAADAHDADG